MTWPTRHYLPLKCVGIVVRVSQRFLASSGVWVRWCLGMTGCVPRRPSGCLHAVACIHPDEDSSHSRRVLSLFQWGSAPLVPPYLMARWAQHTAVRLSAASTHFPVCLCGCHLGWMTSASPRRRHLVPVMWRDGGASGCSLPISWPQEWATPAGTVSSCQWRHLATPPGHKVLRLEWWAAFLFFATKFIFWCDTPSYHADNGSDHDMISQIRKTADTLAERKK